MEKLTVHSDGNNNNQHDSELSIVLSLNDETRGSLARLLTALDDHAIDLLLIETRRTRETASHRAAYEFLITVDTLDVDRVKVAIGNRCRYFSVVAGGAANCNNEGEPEGSEEEVVDGNVNDEKVVDEPWFPRTIDDLDPGSKNIFSFGVELNADHPGFSDEEYRKRRLV